MAKQWYNKMRSNLGTKGFAGDGIISDDYSEESGNKKQLQSVRVRLPNDRRSPESLNGPVIIVQEGRKKDG